MLVPSHLLLSPSPVILNDPPLKECCYLFALPTIYVWLCNRILFKLLTRLKFESSKGVCSSD